jgi:hydroxymethylpyrimidine pyrophosphatase-like HAD family hydrolase/energy-coupling factor transporter ATP-binding protein EcfA2
MVKTHAHRTFGTALLPRLLIGYANAPGALTLPMRYLALATDYDGTLAHDGVVDAATVKALQDFRQSGRKLILVTGRELPDLESVFPHLDLFDRVVAENGALLFNPSTREKSVLAERPPDEFIADLKRRGVSGLTAGDVIVGTWHPHETAVLESIRHFGLDMHIIFNKDAVMALPTGVNKMTGLNRALNELKLSRHNIAGVGDAENDHAFLNCCECSIAVSNAIPAIKERADFVTDGDHGAGVAQLIGRLIEDDLRSLPLNLEKHGVLFGRANNRDIYIDTEGKTVLLCGQSGGGKSTLVAGFVERLVDREHQVCLVDPEGDYENMVGFVTLGDKDHAPSFDEIFQLLDNPASNLIVNLIGVKMQDRPGFFAALLTKLQEKKLRDGRPHWIVIDEAHHLLPSNWAPPSAAVAGQTASLLLITVHPEHVSPAALKLVNILAVIGKEPQKFGQEFASVLGIAEHPIPITNLNPGEASVWFRDSNEIIERMQSVPGKAERKRHRRKYAQGELEQERAFYFRGPEGKLNLRVNNLNTFLQLAAGVDDETWRYHLERGDYSNWLSSSIKDEDLGEFVKRIEENRSLSPAQSREEIAKAIEERYTAPA